MTELEILQQIQSNLVTYYTGIFLFLGVITGILLGLIFWLVFKEEHQ